MIELDHLAASAETLEEATDFVESALGVTLQTGGQHAVFHTHNSLLGLEDGLYFEAIAINPEAPKPDRARWFALDEFYGPARLTNWICRSANLQDTLANIPHDFGAPVALQRGDLSWDMAVPHSGRLPFDSCAPALIQWQTPLHPAQMLMASGVRLRRLTVCHPEVQTLQADLPLADDRIVYETGPAGLLASFDTPHGPREVAG